MTQETKFPQHYQPLPEGYKIYQLDSGHFFWEFNEMFQSSIHWNKFIIRKKVFLHFKESKGKP